MWPDRHAIGQSGAARRTVAAEELLAHVWSAVVALALAGVSLRAFVFLRLRAMRADRPFRQATTRDLSEQPAVCAHRFPGDPDTIHVMYRFYARIDDVFIIAESCRPAVSGFRRIYRRAAATRHLATGYCVVSLNRRRLGPTMTRATPASVAARAGIASAFGHYERMRSQR